MFELLSLIIGRIAVAAIDAYTTKSEQARREGRALTPDELEAIAQESVATVARRDAAEQQAKAEIAGRG